MEGDVLDSAAAGGLLIRGGAIRFAGFVAAVGLSVISAAVLTRYLGVGRFGQYTTVMSLVFVVAVITDAGMSNIGIREYTVLREEERQAMMRELLGLRVTLTLVGALLVTIFAVAAGYHAPFVIGAVAASLATVALVFQHTLSIPLTTDLRLGVLSALELARQALYVGGIVVLAAVGAGVLPLLSIPLPVNLVLIAPTALLVRGRISARPALHPRAWRPLLRATVVFSLATAVGTIYVYTAQILTSLIASRYESGLFAVSFRVFIVSASVPGLLVGAALPVLSRAARDDLDRLAYALQRIFEIALVAGVGAALVMSAGSHFIVTAIAGARYAPAGPVLEIQAFAMIFSFVVAGWSFALLSLRIHRGLLACNAAALLVSVVLTPVLAASDGAQGVAIATVAAETTLAAGALIALVRSRPSYRPQLRSAVKVVLAGGCAAAAAFAPSMPSLVRAVVAGFVYAAIIVATGALPAELKELVRLPRPSP
ncbi:MAG TPA: polysaccharide biosynthesis C-terminal domain-containing protein [Solirubrobacteraceae bacterium]|nr:polysaccharide biosynthesis C-terminal domain-containing protein [Solirubrobacteraceae bacterium]